MNWVKNWDVLATTENRKLALEIMEAGLDAINTKNVVNSSVSLVGEILSIKGKEFDLTKFKNIKVVGFGKSSCLAALALEGILGSKIGGGVVIGLEKVATQYIETFAGSHPRPSKMNIPPSQKIYEIVKDSKADDLIIVLASGGGSALLCYGDYEYLEGVKLYEAFLKLGKTISEINTVRKHLSLLKGGGLVKLAYPSTVIGLIFSDVPGDIFEDVASGPTYKDNTTIDSARKIIRENNLGEFNLIETPKEDKYFEKVHNFVLVSNKTAVEAMAKKVQDFNLEVNIASTDLYDETNKALDKIFSFQKNNSVVLAAGEPSVVIRKKGGKGGRSLHMGLRAIKKQIVDKDSVFISFASDGMDNSAAAGALVDENTIKKSIKLNLNIDEALESFDSYTFFEKTGDMIITGPTGANVSDLMILLTKK